MIPTSGQEELATVEVSTPFGRLLTHRDDEVITPPLANDGVWEPDVTVFLHRALQPGHTFVDVGANIGYFTVLGAERTGPTGRVIAVEPEERNLTLLRANVARNQCENVEVLDVAAYSRPTHMRLDVRESNRGDHRLAPGSREGPLVRCVALDDVLPEAVHVIKIDTQGFDNEVIAGLDRTIAANPGLLVLTELSLRELGSRDVDPAAVLDIYEGMGFRLAILELSGEACPASAEDALSYGAAAGVDVNLVLRR